MELTAARILGPAGHHSTSTNVIADVSTPMAISWDIGSDFVQVNYHGGVSLSDEDIKQLKLGKLYLNLSSACLLTGEVRGQILPDTKENRKFNRH